MTASNATNNSAMLATSSTNATTELACRNNAVGITQALHEHSIAETPISFECDIGKLLCKGINIQNLSRDQKCRLLLVTQIQIHIHIQLLAFVHQTVSDSFSQNGSRSILGQHILLSLCCLYT